MRIKASGVDESLAPANLSLASQHRLAPSILLLGAPSPPAHTTYVACIVAQTIKLSKHSSVSFFEDMLWGAHHFEVLL